MKKIVLMLGVVALVAIMIVVSLGTLAGAANTPTPTPTATPTPLPICSLFMGVNGNGTTDPSEGAHQYSCGSVVAIAAFPAPDWAFREWTYSGGSVADPYSANTTVTLSAANTTATANFYRAAVLTLTPTSGPPGTIVALSGAGFCPGDVIPAWCITLAGIAWNPAAIQISTAGDWTTQLQVPSSIGSGTWEVVATSGNCTLSARTSFTVTACQCVPPGFHAHYAFCKDKSGDLQDTGVDVGLPQPDCPKGWHVIQILVKHE